MYLNKIIKPIIYDTSYKDYPYARSGTWFLCRHENDFFAFTARHAIKNMQIESNNLRLLIFDNSGDTLPIKYSNRYKEPCNDFEDIQIFTIDDKILTDNIREIIFKNAIPCSMMKHFEYNSNSEFIIIGYPETERNEISYDDKQINIQPVALSARFDGESEFEHCTRIEFFESELLKKINNFDGMSGSPVFFCDCSQCWLAGMLIRASNNKGHFIHSYMFLDILNRTHKSLSSRNVI